MQEKELVRIVRAAVDSEIAAGKEVRKPWLVHQLVESAGTLDGDAAACAIACMYFAFGQLVDRVIRTIKKPASPEESAQLTLPGYEHLQRCYVIQRNDESQIVPVERMTIAELAAKAAEHRAMGDGHYAHAEELDAYRKRRGRVA